MEYPKLRYIEAIPAEANGERIVYLRDHQNLSGKVLAVSPETLIVLSLFDGTRSVKEIQTALTGKFGDLVHMEDIENLITQLDEALFLDSDKYRDYKNKLECEFRGADKRESSHAGLSYPADSGELARWIETFFTKAEETEPYKKAPGKLKGIISPHVDYRRGGTSYAKAYRELLGCEEADTFIIYGTSHYSDMENPFILTRKNFITPLGEAVTDGKVVESLVNSCDWDLFEGEIHHRTEHSIEFQIAFLQYLLNGKRDFKIVPILCNSFHRLVSEGRSPDDDEKISGFLNSISEIISALGERVFIIAAADMAHVGIKFGDREPVDDRTLERIRERDILSLTYSEKLDAEGFYRSVEEEKDWRKICGLSPIYATLKTIQADRGKLLDYDQALEPDTGSVVSFASVGLYS